MKTPGWAIFVGIMMILIGGCGALSDGQAILSPKLFSMNEDFMEVIEENSEKEDSETNASDEVDTNTELIDSSDSDLSTEVQLDSSDINFDKEDNDVPEEISELLKISDHYKTWIVRFGYIGLIFSALYIISGFFMIARQRFSLKLTYITLISCIIFALIQIFILTMGEKNIFTIGSSASAGGGILVDLIFIIIITACDTEAYEPESFN